MAFARILVHTPGIVILGIFPDKASAGEAEKEAIKRYGRIGIDEGGTLCNLACGGQGPDAALMQLPEIRQRNSEGQKRRSPESRAKSDAALAAARLDPVAQAKKRETSKASQKEAWADPVTRARRTEGMRGKKKTASPEALAARQANLAKAHSEEAAQARRDGNVEKWKDPDFREKRSRNQAAAWRDPEKRANMLASRSAGISSSWNDLDVRARRIAGIKAAAGARKLKMQREGH